MIERLLPRTVDNSYTGSRAALWILGIIAAVKLAMGINCIFNGWTVMSTADGIPLATYPHDAAQTAVALFAIWAWWLVLFALLAALTLVRYRGLTSLLFAIFLIEHLGRKLILRFIPMVRDHDAPATWINATLLSLMALGFLLSLWQRGRGPAVQRQAA